MNRRDRQTLGLVTLGLLIACAALLGVLAPVDGLVGGVGMAGVLLSLAALGLFLRSRLAGERERARAAAELETRQQQAIMRLLDEITGLANGDLRIEVTVTEQFTGAIADSINATVQTLRRLVGTIERTAVDLTAAAAGTRAIAVRVRTASGQQSVEITDAAAAITATSTSLRTVAGRAETIALDADASVRTARSGAGTVGQTIHHMATLREQIQDTAKRIKRLGESSQEIGTIVEAINDIAEQTNTLALNASIEAARAGDAGRGFQQVAVEIQQLAEHASQSTRQIETRVKTIQADTNEAVTSMERSTAHVIAGAQSAEEAGQALTRIEAASLELARSIEGVAAAARGESAAATRIADTMLSIQQLALQTSDSATEASEAVGALNTLSGKLRESVAGFTLPGR